MLENVMISLQVCGTKQAAEKKMSYNLLNLCLTLILGNLTLNITCIG
jgi:hypothetical protein